MLKQRVITAIILLVGFLGALFYLPDVIWVGLVIGIVLIGVSEWARLAKYARTDTYIYLCLSLILMLALVWFYVSSPTYTDFLHLIIYGVAAVLWILIVPAWMIGSWQVRQPLLMALIGWMLLIPTGLAMVDLRVQSPWLLLCIMSVVWMADIAAYFTGRKFGKHKLAPSISPGKSWEGVGGALLGVSLYVLILIWASGFLATQQMYLGILFLAAWITVGFAVIGDLFESAIKRQAGVKDSGAILPGHGGLLDRIDALTSTLPITAGVLLLQRLI
ncbi:MAG: phosphatidate cytidylyltransferase [Candidatus Nitrotoga sp.]